MAKRSEKGTKLKDRSLRKRPPVYYKAIHADRRLQGDRRVAGAEVVYGDGLGSPIGATGMVMDAEEAAGGELGREGDRWKLPSDLDRGIEELENSLGEVNSQLKQTSLRKHKKQRIDRLDKFHSVYRVCLS